MLPFKLVYPLPEEYAVRECARLWDIELWAPPLLPVGPWVPGPNVYSETVNTYVTRAASKNNLQQQSPTFYA